MASHPHQFRLSVKGRIREEAPSAATISTMHTDRTVLLQPTQDDYDDILNLHTHKQVRTYLGGPAALKNFQRSFQQMISPKPPSMYWIVRCKESNACMGMVSIDGYHDRKRYEMSYQFMPEYWGKGYAQEVCKKVLEYAFQVAQLESIVSETQKKNQASIKLLEKLGMKLESVIGRFGERQAVYVLEKQQYINKSHHYS